jgi:hypothetical protein
MAAVAVAVVVRRLLALAVLRAVQLQRFRYTAHPRICRSLVLDDEKGRLARLSQNVSTKRQHKHGNTHGHHDELLCALTLDTRDHPAHLIALRTLLTARQWRLRLAQPKLSLDTNATSALERFERFEAQQAVAGERKLADLRFTLRYRQREQQSRRAPFQRRFLDGSVEEHLLACG